MLSTSELGKQKMSYRYFARQQLKIVDKAGKLVKFEFNKAQDYVHRCLTDQLKRHGHVRALIIKGRQQGMSTYIAGRFYHRSTMFKGKRVYILSHLSKTTSELFRMVTCFYDNQPVQLRAAKGISNKHELAFRRMRSSYQVGTAGSGAAGRGGTIQLFHGSEAAYWANEAEIQTGLMQSIPSGQAARGTEIILESTANGMQGMFYQLTQAALKGDNEYQVIFVPWYWQDEYRSEVPKDFELTADEQVYKETYGLDLQQVAWMRSKKAEYVAVGKTEWMFKQEYPATIQEAFQASGDPFFTGEMIMAARRRKIRDQLADYIIGVDASGDGGDRTVLTLRKGKVLIGYYVWANIKAMTLVGKIGNLINKYNPVKVWVDQAYGWAVVDRLNELGFKQASAVSFGASPTNDIYLNKRAEMMFSVREWLAEGSIPDNDEIHSDLACLPREELTSTQRIKFVSKEKIKKDYGMSPDILDSLALTFAFPVNSRKNAPRPTSGQTGGLKSMRYKESSKGKEIGIKVRL